MKTKMDKEGKLQVLDITVVIVLFFLACFAGKLVMTYVSDPWLGFNGPALGVLGVGELIWFFCEKKVE